MTIKLIECLKLIKKSEKIWVTFRLSYYLLLLVLVMLIVILIIILRLS